MIDPDLDTKLRVNCTDAGGIGGFIGSIEYDGNRYGTLEPLSDSYWKLKYSYPTGGTLRYYPKTSWPWNRNTAALPDDSVWIWNGYSWCTMIFEFDFSDVIPC